jgi:hypothetical protein
LASVLAKVAEAFCVPDFGCAPLGKNALIGPDASLLMLPIRPAPACIAEPARPPIVPPSLLAPWTKLSRLNGIFGYLRYTYLLTFKSAEFIIC